MRRLNSPQSIVNPQGEQHLSHIARIGHQTKVSAADIGAGIAKILAVKSVEHLPAELQPGAFFEGEVFGDDNVPGLRAGSRQNVAGRVAVGTSSGQGPDKGTRVKDRQSRLDSVTHVTGVKIAVFEAIRAPTDLVGIRGVCS